MGFLPGFEDEDDLLKLKWILVFLGNFGLGEGGLAWLRCRLYISSKERRGVVESLLPICDPRYAAELVTDSLLVTATSNWYLFWKQSARWFRKGFDMVMVLSILRCILLHGWWVFLLTCGWRFLLAPNCSVNDVAISTSSGEVRLLLNNINLRCTCANICLLWISVINSDEKWSVRHYD